MKKYYLASASPRRKELLAAVLPEFEIMPAVSEEKVTNTDPAKVVESLSKQKASEIFHKILTDESSDIVVIGADTVVSYKQKILGKPKDKEQARKMISGIQGDEHKVITGVTVLWKQDGKIHSFVFAEETQVYVYDMTDEEIQELIDDILENSNKVKTV